MITSGLDGVVAAATALSDVDGERGELIIAGYPVDELAAHATFEETTWLLWHGDLPSARELEAFRAELAAARDAAAGHASRCCATAPAAGVDPMDALRMAAGTISLGLGRRAATHRRAACRRSSPRTGGCGADEAPVAPRADLGHAANFLYMLTGEVPDPRAGARRSRPISTRSSTTGSTRRRSPRA